MDHAPAIAEVQAKINDYWTSLKERRDDPPSVLRTLVFYTDDGVLEAFAVVNRYGSELRSEPCQVGDWDVIVVS